jgi:hypothetical protein
VGACEYRGETEAFNRHSKFHRGTRETLRERASTAGRRWIACDLYVNAKISAAELRQRPHRGNGLVGFGSGTRPGARSARWSQCPPLYRTEQDKSCAGRPLGPRPVPERNVESQTAIRLSDLKVSGDGHSDPRHFAGSPLL